MVKKVADKIKEKFVGMAGSATGATSILGSWQVCHNLCLGVITVLSVFGISVVGMPLMFLQKLALPFWIIAASLLVVVLFIYFRKGCISGKLIVFNSGLIIIGIPFKSLQFLSPVFWIVGGTLVIFSILLFVKDKFKGGKYGKNK